AEAVRGGAPLVTETLAHYTAPPIPRPGAVGRLRAGRAHGSLRVRFTGARNATSYIVKVLLTDGRGLLRTLRGSQHQLVVSGVGKRTRARITVTAIGPDGRRGPSRRAALR
ncbi:MAG TPA: hypothetical protein VFN55_00805, partial [Solirubrobacteraceae bacterium]|nr:hypothetical protein [Solirubrobacteraceae bacterium]